jgi:hypothetical protein
MIKKPQKRRLRPDLGCSAIGRKDPDISLGLKKTIKTFQIASLRAEIHSVKIQHVSLISVFIPECDVSEYCGFQTHSPYSSSPHL